MHDYFVRFSYDRLDNVNFPHSGQQASLQWDADRNVTGVDNVTNQVTFSYVGAVSFGRDTLVLSANAGLTLEGNVTDVRLLYPLGGFLNLSGLRADSLLGPDFAIARVLYYRQIGRGGPGYFDFPTYVGVSVRGRQRLAGPAGYLFREYAQGRQHFPRHRYVPRAGICRHGVRSARRRGVLPVFG